MNRENGIINSVLSPHYSLLQFLLKDVLGKGWPCRFQAKGHSMSPFIKDGDVVTISPLSGNSPGIGDVVAFIHPQNKRLIIHRVIRKGGDAYLLKGENASEADGLVKKENIFGVVRDVERGGKKAFLGLGPERFLIAFLTRKGLLLPLMLPVWKIVRSVLPRKLRSFVLGLG